MDKNKIRPLSPHLTIHKKIPSAIFSITHRITGFGLYLGTIIIVIFLFYFGLDENNFLLIKILNNILIIQIFFFLWFFSILYHLINCLRLIPVICINTNIVMSKIASETFKRIIA